jgi:hypothetical protein
MHKAIFLDRDGTINEDVGDLYSPDKLIFIPRAIEPNFIADDIFEASLWIMSRVNAVSKK